MNLAAELARGSAALGLPLLPEVHDALLDYLCLLQRWNQTYNLTAVREMEKMLTNHLLELAVIPALVLIYPAQAQDETLKLRLGKDFGFNAGSQIQGVFNLSAKGPDSVGGLPSTSMIR